MREFFRGWKRNFGMLTLTLACLLMTGWVRSSCFSDQATVPFLRDSSVQILSLRHKLSLMRLSVPQSFGWQSSLIDHVDDHPMNLLTSDWNMRFGSVRLFTNLHAYGDSTVGIVMPYWIPVVSFALLSALLLLSKPLGIQRFVHTEVQNPTDGA